MGYGRPYKVEVRSFGEFVPAGALGHVEDYLYTRFVEGWHLVSMVPSGIQQGSLLVVFERRW